MKKKKRVKAKASSFKTKMRVLKIKTLREGVLLFETRGKDLTKLFVKADKWVEDKKLRRSDLLYDVGFASKV